MSEGLHFDQSMGKKIGGVPVWGAGVGVAALFVAIMYVRNKNKYAQQAAVAQAATPGGTDMLASASDPNAYNSMYGLPNGPIGDWLSQNPTFAGYPVGSGNSGLPGPITNQQWSRLTFDQLVATGDDPTLVSNALSKYLMGNTLSQAEQSVINLALQKMGAPPEGISPVVTTPAPTPTPTPAPMAMKAIPVKTGQHLDSLGYSIADLFKWNPTLKWPRITEATDAGFGGTPGAPGTFEVFASPQYIEVPA